MEDLKPQLKIFLQQLVAGLNFAFDTDNLLCCYL